MDHFLCSICPFTHNLTTLASHMFGFLSPPLAPIVAYKWTIADRLAISANQTSFQSKVWSSLRCNSFNQFAQSAANSWGWRWNFALLFYSHSRCAGITSWEITPHLFDAFLWTCWNLFKSKSNQPKSPHDLINTPLYCCFPPYWHALPHLVSPIHRSRMSLNFLF